MPMSHMNESCYIWLAHWSYPLTQSAKLSNATEGGLSNATKGGDVDKYVSNEFWSQSSISCVSVTYRLHPQNLGGHNHWIQISSLIGGQRSLFCSEQLAATLCIFARIHRNKSTHCNTQQHTEEVCLLMTFHESTSHVCDMTHIYVRWLIRLDIYRLPCVSRWTHILIH